MLYLIYLFLRNWSIILNNFILTKIYLKNLIFYTLISLFFENDIKNKEKFF